MLKKLSILLCMAPLFAACGTQVSHLSDKAGESRTSINEPVASLEKTESHWTYSVTVDVAAAPEALWKLLTTSENFPKWNSTVSKIEGRIALGEKLKVFIPAVPGRAFEVSVTKFEANQQMVWSDQAGARTFKLTPAENGRTTFTMSEKLFAQVAVNVPDMRPTFIQYAKDLKRAGESQ